MFMKGMDSSIQTDVLITPHVTLIMMNTHICRPMYAGNKHSETYDVHYNGGLSQSHYQHLHQHISKLQKAYRTMICRSYSEKYMN